MTSASFTLPTQANRGAARSLTALYFASFIALGLTTGSLGPTLPSLAEQSKAGIGAISYLFTFRSLGYVCGSVRSGKFFDKHSGNIVMGTLILISASASALIPFSNSLLALFSLMFALGVAEGGVDVGANTLLVRVHQDRVGPFMNGMHACFGIGALTAPLIVAKVISHGAKATQTYFVLALLLLPLAFTAFGIRSPQVVEKLSTAVTGKTVKRTLTLLVIFLFLYVGSEVGFGGWLYTYALTTKLGTATSAAYLTSLFWGALTAGRIVLIPLTTRTKPEVIIFGSLTGAVLSLLTMLQPAQSFMLLSITTIALGFSIASIFPATLSFASKKMNLTGRVTGWFVVGASLGSTLLPLLTGKLLISIGPSATILIPLVALTLASGLFVVVTFSTKQQSRSSQK